MGGQYTKRVLDRNNKDKRYQLPNKRSRSDERNGYSPERRIIGAMVNKLVEKPKVQTEEQVSKIKQSRYNPYYKK